MCGIVLVARKDGRPATKQLLKAFEQQRGRGTQGFGFVAFNSDEINKVGRSAVEAKIKAELRDTKSGAILFHHRMPTSTPNFAEATHPIYVSNPRLKFDYYIAHNGVIHNDTTLKTKHEGLGYSYTTEMRKEERWVTKDKKYSVGASATQFNDSEALAIELAEGIESNADKIEAYGSIAFIGLKADKTTHKPLELFYGRNTNPLKLDENNTYLRLASEGRGDEVLSHTLFSINLADGSKHQRACQFGNNYATGYNTNEKYNSTGWFKGHQSSIKDLTDKDDTNRDEASEEYWERHYGIERPKALPTPKSHTSQLIEDTLKNTRTGKGANKDYGYYAVDFIAYPYSEGKTEAEIAKDVSTEDIYTYFFLTPNGEETDEELAVIAEIAFIKATEANDAGDPDLAKAWSDLIDDVYDRREAMELMEAELEKAVAESHPQDDQPEEDDVENPPNYNLK